MRIANHNDRLVLLTADREVDVAEASNGAFPSVPHEIYSRWTEFLAWATDYAPASASEQDPDRYGPLVTAPRQIFAVGLNFHDHAAESGLDAPTVPPVFTKFASSLAGPVGDIAIHGDAVDWEVELVVVIGEGGRDILQAEAWKHVAGLTAGQDVSDRTVQLQPPSPQFSLGKSFRNFAPVGPVLVTPDEFSDPDDLRMTCTVNGEVRQDARSSAMIFRIDELIAHLSSIVELYPGDLIFTGTPAGVGLGMEPQVYLKAGDVLETSIEGIGHMRHTISDTRAS